MKSFLLSILALTLIGGMCFVGYRSGKEKTNNALQATENPTSKPTFVTDTPTTPAMPTVLPIRSPHASSEIDLGYWRTYETTEFGYSIKYPSTLQLQDRSSPSTGGAGGVPSDLWFGERIHIISRIPPLPDDFITTGWGDAVSVVLPQGLEALRLERKIEPLGGGTPRKFDIEYLIRADGADYILSFNPIGTTSADNREEQIFEEIVTTFSILTKRTYKQPSTR